MGKKIDLESKGKFDETSFSLDAKKLQSNYWSCVVRLRLNILYSIDDGHNQYMDFK